MTTQTAAMPATHFRRGWIYALTLALVTINYMDRSALGVVAQAVRAEFKLSPVEMGYLFSSFFWSYVVCMLPIGIMLDRFSTRSINSVGIALWSLAMAATAGVWSFASLIGVRLVMGAGEATSIPSCGRIVREWMPAQERGVANAVWSAGSFLRPGDRRHCRRGADQRLGLARGFHRSRRAWLYLARLQPDLVRPAGESELAHRRRT